MFDLLKNEEFLFANELLKELNFKISFDYFNNEFNKCITYKENQKIVGIILYSYIYDRIEINYIVVNSNYRNKGIATKLLNHLLTLYKDIKNVTLEVRKSNSVAISFYKKNCFDIVAIRKNYYDDEDGILMIRVM